ncbi:hypothetical protein BISA_1382 [Bifidobacterium saguini DSM 23967]|uniref:Uncharacterized protein n=1 Tax=Bifidobacterium saguini DSM 23967 TaxID=1437607 RepID=A0A087DCG6_9BIFI|nr:type I-E CRISPR-associated protein Cse2/CasB [Bifidobacterium saguini]KFI93216.1 hypothetical protein BISA_1382 [Bifidobacterium saguini DSM 23967]
MDDRSFQRLARLHVRNLLEGGRQRSNGIRPKGLVRGDGSERLAMGLLRRLSHNPLPCTLDPIVLEWVEWDQQQPMPEPYGIAAWQTMCLLSNHAQSPGDASTLIAAIDSRTTFAQAMREYRRLMHPNERLAAARMTATCRHLLNDPDGGGYHDLLHCVRLLHARHLGFDYTRMALDLAHLHQGKAAAGSVMLRWMRDYQTENRHEIREEQ